MTLIFFLVSLTIILFTALVFCIIKLFDYEERIEEMVESLQDVYNVLMIQHEKIEAKTKIEIFSDEPIIRDLVSDISLAKDSVKMCSETINSLIVEPENNGKEE